MPIVELYRNNWYDWSDIKKILFAKAVVLSIEEVQILEEQDVKDLIMELVPTEYSDVINTITFNNPNQFPILLPHTPWCQIEYQVEWTDSDGNDFTEKELILAINVKEERW